MKTYEMIINKCRELAKKKRLLADECEEFGNLITADELLNQAIGIEELIDELEKIEVK